MEDAQEALAILVVFKDRIPFIASGDNLIDGNELPRRKQRGIGSEVVFHAPQAAGN